MNATKTTRVIIGIQARLSSTRFPQKVSESFGGKLLIEHVIDSCCSASRYINKARKQPSITAEVALLVPKGQDYFERFRTRDVQVHYGPENDVLTRYKDFVDHNPCDFICRVTGDCPLLYPQLITKCIHTAVRGRAGECYDFVTNAHPRYRNMYDGSDCEVMSKRVLSWLDQNASTKEEREHVTQYLYEIPSHKFHIGGIFGHIDTSSLKLSVDYPEDLEAVKKCYEDTKEKISMWNSVYGKHSSHRF